MSSPLQQPPSQDVEPTNDGEEINTVNRPTVRSQTAKNPATVSYPHVEPRVNPDFYQAELHTDSWNIEIKNDLGASGGIIFCLF